MPRKTGRRLQNITAAGNTCQRCLKAAEKSEDGYNKADYIIGTTLRHMCFDLTVQEE